LLIHAEEKQEARKTSLRKVWVPAKSKSCLIFWKKAKPMLGGRIKMQNMFSLQGKVAIVTGGNEGIGKGMARAFAEYGCAIAIAARNRDKMDAAEKEMEKEFKVPVMKRIGRIVFLR
jgi:hypothetical protein